MRTNNFVMLGNFHSHSNSPARMSEEDKQLAFDKNLRYLILSLAESEAILKSFNIDKNGEVEEEKLTINRDC